MNTNGENSNGGTMVALVAVPAIVMMLAAWGFIKHSKKTRDIVY